MKVTTKELLKVFAMWFLLIALLCLVMFMAGCQTCEECVCPELDLPEVVEVVTKEPILLPVPSPPAFQFCSDLAAVYSNLDEAILKFEECVAIIEANNEAARNP